MKIRNVLFLGLIFIYMIGCKPTYTFIANNCPSLLAKNPNITVKVKKLNKHDKDCRRKGWHLINNQDSCMIAKYKNGEINGKVVILNEDYHIIEKYKVKNGQQKGLKVTYHPINNNNWTSMSFTKNDSTYILKPLRRIHYKSKNTCY